MSSENKSGPELLRVRNPRTLVLRFACWLLGRPYLVLWALFKVFLQRRFPLTHFSASIEASFHSGGQSRRLNFGFMAGKVVARRLWRERSVLVWPLPGKREGLPWTLYSCLNLPSCHWWVSRSQATCKELRLLLSSLSWPEPHPDTQLTPALDQLQTTVWKPPASRLENIFKGLSKCSRQRFLNKLH